MILQRLNEFLLDRISNTINGIRHLYIKKKYSILLDSYTDDGTLFRINEILNKLEYKPDPFNYHKDPSLTVHDNGGDCEDYARLATDLLCKMGRKAFTVIAYGGEGHAFSCLLSNDIYRFIDTTSAKNPEESNYKYNSIQEMLDKRLPTWKHYVIRNNAWKVTGITIREDCQ